MQTFALLAADFEKRLPTPADARRPQTLYEPIRYFLALGGKRVRPVLCLMAAELFAPLTDDAWHAASAIEIFHNFTLVHDDIMDASPLRRGQPTLHEKYGTTTGILGGDALCILAYEQLGQIKKPLQPLLAVFNQTALEVCEGQQLDMDFEQRDDVTVADYIEMIRLKTSVLLGCALKMGALIGSASAHSADKLYQFGEALGIAFQLQDDYLDAFGDGAVTGKKPGGDIRSGKKTFLHLTAMENACDDYTSLYAQPSSDEKTAAVLQLFDACGAKAACREQVERYSQKATQALEEVAVVSSRKAALRELTELLLNRKY